MKPLPLRVLNAATIAGAVMATTLTFLPWITPPNLGGYAWNGFGRLVGGAGGLDAEMFEGALIKPLGWLVAGSAVLVVVLLALRPFAPTLRYVAVAAALVGFGTIVAILVNPTLLVGDLLWLFGVPEDYLSNRQIINTMAMVAELLATGLILLGTTLIARTADPRRTPQAAEHSPKPARRPAPPAGA